MALPQRPLPDARRPASAASRRARSTPSSSPSPTCRAGCRASACTAATSSTYALEARHRGLQLPARGRRRHEHRRRLRDLLVGEGLRRHGVRARLGHHPAAPPPARPRAMVQCDLVWLDHAPGPAVAPRRSSRPSSTASPSAAWSPWPAPSWSSSPSTRRTRTPTTAGYRGLTPVNQYNVDYSILGTTRVEPLLREHPQPHVRRGPRRRGRQGRVQLRAARDRLPLRRRAHHRRQPRRLQDRGEGDRGPAGQGDHVHGEVQRARGQLLPHPSLAARPGRRAGVLGRRGRTRTRSTTGSSPGCWPRCADFTLLYAPNINSYKRFAAGLVRARPRSPGASTTAPARCAWSVHGAGARMENRIPGADVNPYLALAAMLAGGLHGIENELPLRGRAGRQRLHLRQAARAPHAARPRARPSPRSAVAREALGDDVVDHYVNMADVELAAFDAAVTDWELRRGFERM